VKTLLSDRKEANRERDHAQEALKQMAEPLRRISHLLEIAGVKQ
jgi:hypothetical protein